MIFIILDEIVEDDDDSVKDPDYKNDDDESHDESHGNLDCDIGKPGFNDFNFLKIIKSVGKCLLQKSHTPAMKQKKKDALVLVVSRCLAKHGIEITAQQAKRKLDNLKMRVKTKTDKKKTGNIPITLNSADKLLLELLDAEENPSISQLSCK